MLSLAYRIATMQKHVVNGWRDAMRSAGAAIIDTPKINIDSVHEFVVENFDKKEVNFAKKCPNWISPLDAFFEFFSTHENCQLGAFVQSRAVESRWQTIGAVWVSVARRIEGTLFEPGRPYCLGGFLVTAANNGEAIDFRFDASDLNDTIRSVIQRVAFTVGLGISFMHCKNVRQVERKDDPGERFRQQYKMPKFRYCPNIALQWLPYGRSCQ